MSPLALIVWIGLAFVLSFNGSLSSEDVISTGEIITETSQGKLVGSTLRSREGREYFAFKGIPFAKIPQRFEAPIPSSSWDGIRDATQQGPVCPQIDKVTQKTIGEEDCLVLNVFTPKLNGKQPVVVFIHGGAYQYGTGNEYGGSYYADEDTVLVTINYRLNVLGFLSTGDNVVQGNMGLKDQTMALKWIQANIAAFGGDPSRVTLTGTSAGAASASFHILSQMSKGLFHRAVTLSGSALNPWSLHSYPKLIAQELAENLDCPKEPSSALVECLRKTDFRKIVQITLYKWYIDPVCQYAPVIETIREGQDSSELFLAEDPLILLSEGRFNKVPVITGLMEDEGLLFHAAAISKNQELQRTMNEDWNTVAPITLLYDRTPNADQSDLTDISRTIRGFYFGQQRIDSSTLKNLTHLYSDRFFNHGVKQAALLQAKYIPVYAGIFGFHGDWSILNLFFGDAFKEPIGVSHGDDMQYFFNSPRFPQLKIDSKSEEFSKAIVKLWAYFARTGNVMESLPGSPSVHWLPISPEEIKRKRIKWYNLNFPPKVLVREPFTDRVEFWDKIIAQLNAVSDRKLSKNEVEISLKEEL